MKTSIVILTHNQLAMTIGCLESIRRHTPEEHEIIIIDNGSTDGTPGYARLQPDVILHENKENLGFAKGCNQGVELATGDNVLFLNNDTIMTKDWLKNMLQALYSSEHIGMVGPVTNYSSGHQRIPVTYTDLAGLDAFSKSHIEAHAGSKLSVRRLVGFCLLVKRTVLDEIGGFDERFGLGNYEDDDLCLRAIRQGYGLYVAMDSFIHHYGHATMNQLPSDNLNTLLQQNSKKATEKWGNNIHELIYRPEISVSLCVVAQQDAQRLRHTLATWIDAVEETIVIVPDADGEAAEIAGQYTDRVFAFYGEGDGEEAYQFAFDLATKDFVLFLEPGDELEKNERRKFSGLKISVEDADIVVLPSGENEQRFMVRKDSGFASPDRLEEDAAYGGLRLNAGVTVRNRF
ncbi:glycosyltransferase family 2 protein [Paenibacillus sp. GCM10012307]|uniref:Glycosyltransferase family 2 protein n=1 Tax=Paenibacillus roseus TaxID=2798579 RepID=A0A934MW27_9BACL|nr:glycosyltransferase family 2 protein [Paenibacillus roseus]MBJ6362727.1 glycosyltransferase family 2 protein [Paenibacillus roseus]